MAKAMESSEWASFYARHGIPLHESATASLARASTPAETEDHVIENEDISNISFIQSHLSQCDVTNDETPVGEHGAVGSTALFVA